MAACALCAALSEEHRLVYQDEHCFSIVNKEPLNSSHLMVLPRRHVTTLSALTPEELGAMFAIAKRLADITREAFPHSACIGFNTGDSPSQEHIHMHLFSVEGGLRDLYARATGAPHRKEAGVATLKEIKELFVRRLEGTHKL